MYEGDVASAMYLLRIGTLGVYVQRCGRESKVTDLLPGAFFGEIGLLDVGAKRTASIKVGRPHASNRLWGPASSVDAGPASMWSVATRLVC